MNARRIAGSLMFAAAAFASIATSAPQQPLNWELTATAPIESTMLTSGPATAFGITAEARGPRNGHQGGEIDLAIEVTASFENLEPASVTLVLVSETDPTQRDEQQVVIGSGSQTSIGLFLPAWSTCEAGPCFEDFRLEIANTTANTTVTITGEVQAVLRGQDETPEPDSDVLVAATPLGAL